MNSEQLKLFISKYPGVIVYFYSEDCGVCKALRPMPDKLVQQFPKMKTLYINSLQHPATRAEFGVFESPTILIFFEGKETARFGRYMSLQILTQAVERTYNLLFG
jgi:thioredoxin 1